jgi:hypothetical protein
LGLGRQAGSARIVRGCDMPAMVARPRPEGATRDDRIRIPVAAPKTTYYIGAGDVRATAPCRTSSHAILHCETTDLLNHIAKPSPPASG